MKVKSSRFQTSRDALTPAERSKNMAKIGQRDTKPEVKVRSLLHRGGFRFRKNVNTLPGKPDIVMPKYRLVIFVHGCFWHRHDCRKGNSTPTSRREFWQKKFQANVSRDCSNFEKLDALGWKVFVIWECELNNTDCVMGRLVECIRQS